MIITRVLKRLGKMWVPPPRAGARGRIRARGISPTPLLHWKQMAESRLELRGVSKTYRNGGQPVEVLHEVSFAAAAGTVTALVGRSGCGKTTLLNLAGAMDFPSAGEVLIDGRATASLSERELTALRRARVGFVFQFFQLLPNLTVLENVELPLLLSGARHSLETARDRLRWVELE